MATEIHKQLDFPVPFIFSKLYARFQLRVQDCWWPANADRKAIPFEHPNRLPSSVLNHASLENEFSLISRVSFSIGVAKQRAGRSEEVRRCFRSRGWCI